jgi:hypothetical protein
MVLEPTSISMLFGWCLEDSCELNHITTFIKEPTKHQAQYHASLPTPCIWSTQVKMHWLQEAITSLWTTWLQLLCSKPTSRVPAIMSPTTSIETLSGHFMSLLQLFQQAVCSMLTHLELSLTFPRSPQLETVYSTSYDAAMAATVL